MTPAPIRTSGNARPWQYRQSADRLGSAYHRHGPLLPMQESKPRWWQRIAGKERPHD